MAQTINLDVQDLTKEIKVTVRLTRLKQFRFRLWLAEKLVRIGMYLSWINYEINEQHPLEWFGEQGLVISIAYGPMGNKGSQWSVDLLNDETKESFDRPYQANSFSHCIEIAEAEAAKRGWLE